MPNSEKGLAKRIRASEKDRKPVEAPLTTDERVLARITDGIYRQPSSALRELISNAYDADATEVVILTDAPRFDQISVRDNGNGLSPEILGHLIGHIGGSAKHSDEGQNLGVTAKKDQDRSPGGRQLIGKLGIGLFSVAQFTRHFLIITKTKGEKYRTVADITLAEDKTPQNKKKKREIAKGSARIWRERASDQHSQGTEIRLLDLLPRTRAELASHDFWTRVEFEEENTESEKTNPPTWHIGRMDFDQKGLLKVQPHLPWSVDDLPQERFRKLIGAVRDAAETTIESADLDIVFDRYLQTIWSLALSAPLKYVDGHPFDLVGGDEPDFFKLENTPRGQASTLKISESQSPRKVLKLHAQNGTWGKPFDVFIDGIQLFRPILYKNLPKTKTLANKTLLFLGQDDQKFEKKPRQLSGGPLSFEAYLFWSPRIIPKQHQGVMIRVGNASGTLFDRTFMGYQVSEQTRLRQITAEIFVKEGLEDAINIDRESFNYAHPHYQYLVKWLHSALRQLTNRHKEIGKNLRIRKTSKLGTLVREKITAQVEASLLERGIDEAVEVELLEQEDEADAKKLRGRGVVALRKSLILPPTKARHATVIEKERQKLTEKKAVAIAQILHGWGLLEKLTFSEQEALIKDILEIVLQS